MTDLDDITVVTEPSREFLNQRQLVDYRSRREACLRWLLTYGKDPETVEGYARTTVKPRAHRLDRFYRWVWDEESQYVADPTHDHADAFLTQLAYEDRSNADRSNYQKAIQMLMKWRHHERGHDEYDPAVTYYSDDSASQPRDYLTREERSHIREAALEYGSIPAYNDLSPDQRERWRAYLAQRFEKPKSAVSPADWDRANGWKIPSLVATSLDTGLRPIEVERAKTYWVDVPNRVLRIPKDDSSKNTENWTVSIQERTAEMLERWLAERETYEMYAETDTLWLTRQANVYQSRALKHVLERLCEIAGIDSEGRQMSWYAIRHSVGTYMAREEGLAAAQAQLRHKSEQTTMKYDQTPPEDRRAALDRMG
ncbi:tyrosine-type recombinase/integrase [Halobacteriales archaeon Cl-PHB]